MSDSPNTNARPEDMAYRWGLAQALGETRGDSLNTYEVFNWDEEPSIDDYYASFLRSRYGGPVVEIPAQTSWRDSPEVSDDSDDGTTDETVFESELATLVDATRLWNYGKRIDVLAGIGEFGILVLELDDIDGPEGFDTEATSATTLTGLRPFSEKSIETVETGNPGSGRWGEPVRYELDLDEDDTSPFDDIEDSGPSELWVHHSRVIHVPSDGLLDDEVRGRPRQEGVWNTLTDIEKTMGSSAELAYRATAWGLAINIAKDFNLEDGGDDLREQLMRWYNGLEPILRTQGAESIQNLGGEDIDPSPIINPNLEALAAQTGIPQKVLKGNESGEVAGSQDLQSFYGTIQERREQFVTPVIVRQLVQRLIDLGVIPSPTGGGFSVSWPALAEQDEQTEATIQLDRAKTAKTLAPFIPGYGGEEWREYAETGEFPDVDTSVEDSTGIEPMDMTEERQRIMNGDLVPDGGGESNAEPNG